MFSVWNEWKKEVIGLCGFTFEVKLHVLIFLIGWSIEATKQLRSQIEVEVIWETNFYVDDSFGFRWYRI